MVEHCNDLMFFVKFHVLNDIYLGYDVLHVCSFALGLRRYFMRGTIHVKTVDNVFINKQNLQETIVKTSLQMKWGSFHFIMK